MSLLLLAVNSIKMHPAQRLDNVWQRWQREQLPKPMSNLEQQEHLALKRFHAKNQTNEWIKAICNSQEERESEVCLIHFTQSATRMSGRYFHHRAILRHCAEEAQRHTHTGTFQRPFTKMECLFVVVFFSFHRRRLTSKSSPWTISQSTSCSS